ncbi:hypothetical protein LCGC14_1553560 [marine sediment metagenome]|uniref:Uncharacterized protein n=1 Tax=marine sediment metagenome TaxID=412755 RepID=A0A0F9JAM3_9ZZZZ
MGIARSFTVADVKGLDVKATEVFRVDADERTVTVFDCRLTPDTLAAVCATFTKWREAQRGTA